MVPHQVQALGVCSRRTGANLGVARQINRIELYRQAATHANVAVPAAMRSSILLDGTVWDGKDATGYAASFEGYGKAASHSGKCQKRASKRFIK